MVINAGNRVLMPSRLCLRGYPLAMLATMCVLSKSAIVSAQPAAKNAAPIKAEFVAEPKSKPSTDAFGDPLPAGARLRFGTVRFHPPAGVSELALSPDEKTLVTIGNQIIAWDPESGKELWRSDGDPFGQESRGSRYGARPLAFSSDNSHFFTTSGPVEIAIWNIATRQVEHLHINTGPEDAQKQRAKTLSLDVTPDGKTFALGRADSILVFDRDGNVRYEIKNTVDAPFSNDNRDRLGYHGHYTGVRFSPDGTKLTVVTSDQPEAIRIYDTQSGRELPKIPLTSKLVRLAFSPDGKQIAATERDSSVRLYEVDSGKRIWSHTVELNNPYENYLSAVSFSPDGKIVVVGATDHLLHIIDSSTGDDVGQLEGTHWYPWTMAFTANSKMLYSAGWDGTIRRWDMATQKQLALPHGFHATEVIAASPDGQTVAYQDDARTIRLVKSDSGQELKQIQLPGMHFSQLQFSPDGKLLAGGGSSGDQVQVAVWNVKSGERFRFWSWPKGRDPHSQIEALCFAPDGRQLAAAVFRQGAGYLWDLARDQQIAELRHPEIYGLSFSPDSKTLATAGWDSIVRFWEADRGELTREFRVSTEKDDNGPRFAIARKPGEKVNLNQRIGDLRMYAVCYAPESGLIATAHMNSEVWIWEASTMQPQAMFSAGGSFVYGALSFSPDGLWLATGSGGGEIKLWDPLTAQLVWSRGRHEHFVYTVGFGQDSRTLVSGSDDGLCYLWDLQPTEAHPHADDLPRLWADLASENSTTAYNSMWAIAESKDRTVNLIAEKLRPVERLIDTKMAQGISPEEQQRRLRMLKLLADKDPKVELTIVARRAIPALGQIGTPAAIQLLEELAKSDCPDLRTIAKNTLNRYRLQK